jgi:hypothetical protein
MFHTISLLGLKPVSYGGTVSQAFVIGSSLLLIGVVVYWLMRKKEGD